MFQQFLQQQAQMNQALTNSFTNPPTITTAPAGNQSGINLQLPSFHGRAGENVTSWLFQIDEVFQARNISDASRLHYVVGSLKEAALQWYQNRVQSDTNRTPFADWNAFSEAILKAFQPPNYQRVLRLQLEKLKQTTTVQDYVYRFRNVVGQIKGMGEDDQVIAFMRGLKSATRSEVNYQNPENLEKAIEIAIRFDTANYGPRKLLNYQGYNVYDTATTTSQRYDLVTPILKENDTVSNGHSTTAPMELDMITTKPARTNSDKEQYRQKGLCYYCGRHGHISKNCPSRRPKDM